MKRTSVKITLTEDFINRHFLTYLTFFYIFLFITTVYNKILETFSTSFRFTKKPSKIMKDNKLSIEL